MSRASSRPKRSRRSSASRRRASICPSSRRSSRTRRWRRKSWRSARLGVADIGERMATALRSVATASPRRLPPRALAWMLGAAGGLVAIAAWTLLSHLLAHGGGVINRLPGPLAVARELVQYARSELVKDLAFSLRVFAIGWLIGAAGAAV